MGEEKKIAVYMLPDLSEADRKVVEKFLNKQKAGEFTWVVVEKDGNREDSEPWDIAIYDTEYKWQIGEGATYLETGGMATVNQALLRVVKLHEKQWVEVIDGKRKWTKDTPDWVKENVDIL